MSVFDSEKLSVFITEDFAFAPFSIFLFGTLVRPLLEPFIFVFLFSELLFSIFSIFHLYLFMYVWVNSAGILLVHLFSLSADLFNQ